MNTIDTYMKTMVNAAGLTLEVTGKKLTNHSFRKTTVKQRGVPKSRIAAITGHCNEQSLQRYAELVSKTMLR